MKSITVRALIIFFGMVLFVLAFLFFRQTSDPERQPETQLRSDTPTKWTARSNLSLNPFQQKLVFSMEKQKSANIRYKDEYYSGGEPPANIGVCTDVIVRAFREASIDLRKQVASDIASHSDAYDISSADSNIDHRRCKNLIVFFKRHAETLSNSGAPEEWLPGDIVFYDTGSRGKIDHVALVGSAINSVGQPTIVQAWPGMFVHEADLLFGHKIVGHFRWSSS